MTTLNETDLIWDFILENELCSEETIRTVTRMDGYSVETLNLLLNVLTEYHDIEQIYACEKENFYFNDDILNFYELEEKETDEV